MNRPEPKYRFVGNIDTIPLPVILKKVYAYGVPGVITLRRPPIEKRLYVRHGRIIFAASNLPADRLGEFLIRRGILDAATYEEAVRLWKQQKNKRIGRILVEMGVLTARQLFQVVQQQIEEIVLSVFEWDHGEVDFLIGQYRDQELIKLNMTIPRTIIAGVRRLPDTRMCIEHIGGLSAYLRADPRLPMEVHELGLEPEERRVLPLLDGQRPLADILHEGPLHPDRTVRLLYGLYVLERVYPVERRFRLKVQSAHALTTDSVQGDDTE